MTPKPILFKTVPKMLNLVDCNCKKQPQKADLCMNQDEYLIHVFHWCWILINCWILGHKRVLIEHCKCRGLVDTLFLMQMMTSSACIPRTGIHFGLLEHLYLLKINSQVYYQAFTDTTNKSIVMSQLEPKEVGIGVRLQDKERRPTNCMPWQFSIKYRPFSNLVSCTDDW